MNSVHLVTQEKYRVEKRIENRLSAPSAQPKASLRAQVARTLRAQRLPAARLPAPRTCLPRAPVLRLPRACAPPAARLPLARVPAPAACAPSAPPVRPAPTCARLLRPACRIVACAATQFSSHCSSCHNTIFLYCNTNSLQPSLLQYNPCSLLLAIQYLYCNTLQPSSPFKLQYKPCLATQNFLFSQYNLGSSPIQYFCTNFFFRFFSL